MNVAIWHSYCLCTAATSTIGLVVTRLTASAAQLPQHQCACCMQLIFPARSA